MPFPYFKFPVTAFTWRRRVLLNALNSDSHREMLKSVMYLFSSGKRVARFASPVVFGPLRELPRISPSHALQLFTILCDGLTHQALRVFIVSLGYELSEPVGEA